MDIDFKEIVKENLKEIRNDSKMTQKEFSEFIGISQQTLSGYENGKMLPSLEVVKDIAQKCNISCDWLLGISKQKSMKKDFELYSDLMSFLISITNAVPCDFEIVPSYDPYVDSDVDFNALVIKDGEVQKFIKEWKEIYKLKENGIISKDLYNLWIKDKMDNYNYKINKDEDLASLFL